MPTLLTSYNYSYHLHSFRITTFHTDACLDLHHLPHILPHPPTIALSSDDADSSLLELPDCRYLLLQVSDDDTHTAQNTTQTHTTHPAKPPISRLYPHPPTNPTKMFPPNPTNIVCFPREYGRIT